VVDPKLQTSVTTGRRAGPASVAHRTGKRVAVYARIQAYCRQEHGFLPQTCWIADVLSQEGLTRRQAPNRKDPSQPKKPCPPNRRAEILEAIQALGLERATP
jgi:hypothetical protein